MTLTLEAELSFPDKDTMLMTCGPNDMEIRAIEQAHNVQATLKGLRVVFSGAQANQALEALKALQRSGGSAQVNTLQKGSAKPRTMGQESYYITLRKHAMVVCEGPAGTGKTRMAVDAMVEYFKTGVVDRLILSRPAVEAGERLGFLPGDLKDKLDPYMQPLYDALLYHYPAKILQGLIEEKRIEIAPIAFLRGRTLSNAGIVIDEVQNLTRGQTKMALTRLGEGSKMVLVGDQSQIDIPRDESGLGDALERLAKIQKIGISRLTRKDVVRHPLVGEILDAYK